MTFPSLLFLAAGRAFSGLGSNFMFLICVPPPVPQPTQSPKASRALTTRIQRPKRIEDLRIRVTNYVKSLLRQQRTDSARDGLKPGFGSTPEGQAATEARPILARLDENRSSPGPVCRGLERRGSMVKAA